MAEFTHIQNERAQMVDISAKNDIVREAVAVGKIFLKPETMDAIRHGTVVKGNVLSTAHSYPYVPFDPNQCGCR
jgi:cyclic pyranopterin phosphate synthase